MQIKLWIGARYRCGAVGSCNGPGSGRFNRSMQRRHVFNSSEEGRRLWRSQGRPDLVCGIWRSANASVPS